jgi:hypothetical protein
MSKQNTPPGNDGDKGTPSGRQSQRTLAAAAAAAAAAVAEEAIHMIEQIIRETVPNVAVNLTAITREVTKMMGNPRVEWQDAADVCKMFNERTAKEIFKTFTDPELTGDQVAAIQTKMARRFKGGRGKKKRRTGKKTKGKMHNNSRTIKKKREKKKLMNKIK